MFLFLLFLFLNMNAGFLREECTTLGAFKVTIYERMYVLTQGFGKVKEKWRKK